MFNVWTWFQYCLAVHPLKTEVISSGLIWGAGDIAAQAINNYTAAADKPLVFQDDERPEKINWKRVATTSLFGFGFVGPVGHFWSRQIHEVTAIPPQFAAIRWCQSGDRWLHLRAVGSAPVLHLHGHCSWKERPADQGRHEERFPPGFHVRRWHMADHSGGELPLRPCEVSAPVCQLLLLDR
ncbi:unnamed protein product [Linum tenue]|uniref:PXMP2/4 family protein 2 n=1 Tax=Linum tenue TaxID=586396 RepID=A0AAV0M5L2_9ROSI|nr:unnamed protein product [Linum tenue]